jgi:hypothetical protein
MQNQRPLPNRACGFPAHGLPVVCRLAALRVLLFPEGWRGIADGPTQAIQPKLLVVLAVPALGLARLQVATGALDAQALQPPHDVTVHRCERPGRVAAAEVLPQPRSTGFSSAMTPRTSWWQLRLGVSSRTRCLTRFIARWLGQRCR